MIPVTKPYLPNREKLNQYIDGIYERNWLTNNGPLLQELTERLKKYLGVENLLLVSNGTLALQIAYRALGITGSNIKETTEAITTPFTFIATASSLKWERIEPVFSDIDAETWCLDPAQIESKITPNTKAIVPVHVFGNACQVEDIDNIARKHDLKVVYDAAHAFGVTYKGQSLLNYGDAATLSFHSTKLFHSIEGGAIVFKNKQDLDRAKQIINFGISSPDNINTLGINAKMNEFQAAMGLCVLDEIEIIKSGRQRVWNAYEKAFSNSQLRLQQWNSFSQNNYAYAPVVFPSEQALLDAKQALEDNDILPRRYFYPSLDTLFYLNNKQPCKESRNISNRILCLPIYPNFDQDSINKITQIIGSL